MLRHRALSDQPLHEREVPGDEEDTEPGGDEHSPEHGSAHHVLGARSRSAGQHQRHDAENEGERAVIKIGRKRSRADSNAAASTDWPSSCLALANSTIRIAFFAASPTSMIRPI